MSDMTAEDERENEVWEEVIQACKQAWPDQEKVFYNQSPVELITDLINERDEALEAAARAREQEREAIARWHDEQEKLSEFSAKSYHHRDSAAAIRALTEGGGE